MTASMYLSSFLITLFMLLLLAIFYLRICCTLTKAIQRVLRLHEDNSVPELMALQEDFETYFLCCRDKNEFKIGPY